MSSSSPWTLKHTQYLFRLFTVEDNVLIYQLIGNYLLCNYLWKRETVNQSGLIKSHILFTIALISKNSIHYVWEHRFVYLKSEEKKQRRDLDTSQSWRAVMSFHVPDCCEFLLIYSDGIKSYCTQTMTRQGRSCHWYP